MDREILEKMRQYYEDVKKIAEGDFSEIEKLKEDPNVKRYLYLLDLKQDRYIVERGQNGVLTHVITKYGYGAIKGSDHIWYYLCERPAGGLPEMFSISDEDRKQNKMMVIYRDIEDSLEWVAISKDKQKEFESSHKVVVDDSQRPDYEAGYYQEQASFFEDCIKKGSEEAEERLFAKYNRNQII